MLEPDSQTVTVGESVVVAAVVIGKDRTVLKVCVLDAFLIDNPVGPVVKVVSAEIHSVVKEGPGSVETGHPGLGDSVPAAPASLAAAHSAATSAHSLHHPAGDIVETTVVGVVGIEDEADIALGCELSYEGTALIAEIGIKT